jgi:glycosyltransferase involved in cell wall biosynthesis
VHNGVDSEIFAPDAEGRQNDDLVVGFLGRPGIEKAPDVLLEAVAAMQDTHGVRVLLAGLNHLTLHVHDEYQARLDVLGARIRDRGGEFARVGRLSRAETPDFLRKLDVAVVPSRWEEPCALVVLESMATGLPVVASRTGGTPELLGDAGFLFEREDVTELARILDMLRGDPIKRKASGAAARCRALQFTWGSTWAGLSSSLPAS